MLRKSSFAGIPGLLAWAPLAVADTLPAADSQVNLTAVAAKAEHSRDRQNAPRRLSRVREVRFSALPFNLR
jgi:hypothetical protein